jgi:hypothetical protein
MISLEGVLPLAAAEDTAGLMTRDPYQVRPMLRMMSLIR